MLNHLTLHQVSKLQDVIPLITTEWQVFRFPIFRASKPAMYGRMWRIRELGIDAMVREYQREYLLLARKEHGHAGTRNTPTTGVS